jgi:site-specific DNA-methyltransferase (cytosine-N4-specific)
MCTDKNDLVVDPFGGSCITGEVCERLQRNWVCCELDKQYLEGAKARFFDRKTIETSPPNASYQISTPCSLPIDDSLPLEKDGGEKRRLSKSDNI